MPCRYATYSEANLKAEKAEGVTYDPQLQRSGRSRALPSRSLRSSYPRVMQMSGEACRARSSPERNPTRRPTGFSQLESR